VQHVSLKIQTNLPQKSLHTFSANSEETAETPLTRSTTAV
jgi:hypothetical protein